MPICRCCFVCGGCFFSICELLCLKEKLLIICGISEAGNGENLLCANHNDIGTKRGPWRNNAWGMAQVCSATLCHFCVNCCDVFSTGHWSLSHLMHMHLRPQKPRELIHSSQKNNTFYGLWHAFHGRVDVIDSDLKVSGTSPRNNQYFTGQW